MLNQDHILFPMGFYWDQTYTSYLILVILPFTKNYKVEVSKQIKEEFENGKEYYQYHGSNLSYLPARELDKPNEIFIDWHNNIFKGWTS